MRGDITSRLSSTLRAGFESRQPDRSDLTKYNGLVASGDITYLATERTKLTLYLERSTQESVFQSNLWYLSNIAALSVEHFFTSKLLVTGRIYGGSTTIRTRGSRSTSRRTGGRTGSSAPPSGRSTRSRSGWP